MDIRRFMKQDGEKPLDNIVTNGGLCASFRTIGCIGDSLASGELQSFEFGQDGYHDYFEYSWGQFMARDAGCEVRNFSRGGMTAQEYICSFAKEKGFLNPDLRCQAYIIALGVNDIYAVFNEKLELGTIDDINPNNYSENKPTFAGYYGAIISKYKEIQPHARFFLMTAPRQADRGTGIEELFDRHAELLHEMARLFSNCYVLDFRKYAPEYDEEFRRNFYLNGHMSVQGYRLTALMTESYIDYLMRTYPEDFRKIGFIGKLQYSSK